MRHPHRLCLVLFGYLAASAAARADGLAGPVLGFMPDPAGHTVRVIRGMPGSSSWGDPVEFSAAKRVVVFPRQPYALVIEPEAVRVGTLTGDAAGTASDPVLSGDFTSAPAAFSPASGTAAIYDGANRAFQVIAVQAGSVPALRTIDASMLSAAPAALAVSDQPDPLLAGVPGDDSTSVFVLDTNGSYRTISGFGNAVSVAFIAGSNDLVIADRGALSIAVVHDPLSGAAPVTLYSMPGSSDGAVVVASSADGRRIAVLNGGSNIALVSIADGQTATIDCECAPTGLDALNGNAVFRLTDSLAAPLWLLDGTAADPAIVFVPALPSAPGDQP